MRAVVYHGERDVRVEDVPDPVIAAPDDAIVRVRSAAICGSDLHFYHGRVPGVFEGTVVGHEFSGEVVATGPEVTRFREGDRVVGSFQIACGRCAACAARRFNHCDDLAALGYGVFVGDLPGAQAEYVRVPHADVNLLAVPGSLTPDRALFAGDVLTTAWYAGAIAEIGPGDDVVVIGCGPVGLLTHMAARAMGAARVVAVDVVPSRLETAARLGALPVDSSARAPSIAVEELLGRSADVVVETVGLPPALVTAIDCVRAGGMVAVIGVHTELEFPLPLATLFTQNVTLRFGGLCNVQAHWEEALGAIADGRADPLEIVTHRLPLDDAAKGYRLFDEKQALKVLLEL